MIAVKNYSTTSLAVLRPTILSLFMFIHCILAYVGSTYLTTVYLSNKYTTALYRYLIFKLSVAALFTETVGAIGLTKYTLYK